MLHLYYDVKMIRINFQSDFKLVEKNLNGDTLTPFRFTYRTVLSGCVVAEFDGHEYRNCRRLDDGNLLVIFDNHNLRPGKLSVRREYCLTDADFIDGVCNLVSMEDTGVVLVTGRTSEYEANIMSYPDYAAYNAVQCNPLSDNEYEDVLSGFVPPEPSKEEEPEEGEESEGNGESEEESNQ